MEKQNPGMAAVLSFLFNGLGQIYNGQIAKGLTIMFISAIGLTVTCIGAIFMIDFILTNFAYRIELMTGVILFLSGLIVIAILGVYNIYDAYYSANK